MGRVHWWIVILIGVSLFLGGLLAGKLLEPSGLYAQVVEPTGISADFIARSFRTSQDRDGIFVIDTRLRRMNVYRYDRDVDALRLVDRRDLTREFQY